MNQFMQWCSMGGYSMYVWPAYGLVVGFLIVNLAYIYRQRKNTHKKLLNWFNQ